MKHIWHLLILFFVMGTLKSFSQNTDSIRSTEVEIQLENAFDFWIGEWEVSWLGKDSTMVKGTNRITKILDNKVIQEQFVDPNSNFKGTSISVFNPRTKEWHQAWADNQGSYYDFVGEIDGVTRIFKTIQKDTRDLLYRMIFLEIKKDSFVWKWEGRKEDTKDWKLLWEIRYKRKN